jgi:periplasmic divalent cation tolerance protein
VKFITLFLTCADREEARKIAKELLSKKLAACVRLTDVNSTYWWKDKIEDSSETLLMIESAEDKFDEIEATVRSLHSYETFVLTAYPVIKVSTGVEEWMKEAIDVGK